MELSILIMCFAAILKNEIGWFDDTGNTSSMLSSRLESDATLLRTIVVDRSTILLQNVGLLVASLIIAFILNWRITLVVLAAYPLLICGHISEVKLSALGLMKIKFCSISMKLIYLPFFFFLFSSTETFLARLRWQLEQNISKS